MHCCACFLSSLAEQSCAALATQPASSRSANTHLSFIRPRTDNPSIASPPRDTGHLQSSSACALDSILQPTLYDRKPLLRHFYGPIPTKARPVGSTGLRLKADHRSSGREIQVGNPPRPPACSSTRPAIAVGSRLAGRAVSCNLQTPAS